MALTIKSRYSALHTRQTVLPVPGTPLVLAHCRRSQSLTTHPAQRMRCRRCLPALAPSNTHAIRHGCSKVKCFRLRRWLGAPRRGELFRRSPGSVIGAIPPTHNKITDDLMTVLRVGRGDRIKLWKCSAAFCCAHDYSSRVERAAQHHPTLQSRSKPPRHAFNSTCIDTTLCLLNNSRQPTGKATALIVETWRCLCLVATRSSVT